MFQSAVNLIYRLKTRRQIEVSGLIHSLKEVVTSCHDCIVVSALRIPLKGEVSNRS